MKKEEQRESVISHTVTAIQNYIKTSGLSMGEKLSTELELSEMIGVGRSTVREAERVMETQGWLTLIHGRGAFVAKTAEFDPGASVSGWLSQQEYDLRDMLEFRRIIEPYMAQKAAGKATPEQLADLGQALQNYRFSIQREDDSRILLFEEAFHEQIICMGNNRLIAVLHSIFIETLRRSFAVSECVEISKRLSSSAHPLIYNAIADGDVELAYREMRKHIEDTCNAYTVLFERTTI